MRQSDRVYRPSTHATAVYIHFPPVLFKDTHRELRMQEQLHMNRLTNFRIW